MAFPLPTRTFLITRWCMIAMLALGLPLHADYPLPPKPPGMLYDDARLFNADQAAQLSALQRECEARTGVRVYMAAFTLLQRHDLNRQTQALVRPWLGDETAILIAFHRGSKQATVALAPEMWRKYPSSDLVNAFDSTAALITSKSQPDDAQRMIDSVKEVIKSFQTMENQRQARLKLFTRREIILAGALSGVVLLMGIAAWVALARMRTSDQDRSVRYEFPQVEVATRLGAPLGGGVIGEAAIES